MQKYFGKFLPALLGVGLERAGQKTPRAGTIEMALFLLRRIPGTKFPFEDNPISGVQEHLSGTASRPWISRSGPPERQADVADAFPRCGQSPRFSTSLIKKGAPHVPSAVRLGCEIAPVSF